MSCSNFLPSNFRFFLIFEVFFYFYFSGVFVEGFR